VAVMVGEVAQAGEEDCVGSVAARSVEGVRLWLRGSSRRPKEEEGWVEDDSPRTGLCTFEVHTRHGRLWKLGRTKISSVAFQLRG